LANLILRGDMMDERGKFNFENRSHPRFSVTLPIEYWPVNSSENKTGHTANVSEDGLLIHVPEQMKIGKNLRLKIFLGVNPTMNFIEALVEVVWKESDLGKDQDYRIGTKYVGISPEDMNKLKTFLSNLTSKNINQGDEG
jgi:c-di-GMP-binding flagellar brake protein YcgR